MPTTYNKLVAKMFSISEELEREVKELEFGCKVDCEKFGTGKILSYDKSDGQFYIIFDKGEDCDWVPGQICSPIGSDLTLEDVLKVVKIKDEPFRISPKIKENEVWIIIGMMGYEQVKVVWQLGISLKNQEEETLKKLLEILN